MPRRINDYPDAFIGWNQVASLGSIISIVASVVFIYVVYDQLTNGLHQGNKALESQFKPSFMGTNLNVEGYTGPTLEWTVSTPPSLHAFNTPAVLY